MLTITYDIELAGEDMNSRVIDALGSNLYNSLFNQYDYTVARTILETEVADLNNTRMFISSFNSEIYHF